MWHLPSTPLLAKASAALETVTASRLSGPLGRHCQGAGRCHRAAGPCLGQPSATSTAWPTRPSCAPPTTRRCPQVTEFWTRLGADERLYAKYKAIDPNSVNAEQAQALKNAIRNFVLSGAELTGAAKQRYAQIQERRPS
jgi:oligopeptidase A